MQETNCRNYSTKAFIEELRVLNSTVPNNELQFKLKKFDDEPYFIRIFTKLSFKSIVLPEGYYWQKNSCMFLYATNKKNISGTNGVYSVIPCIFTPLP